MRSRSNGQIIYIDDKRGFAREGDVIARILDPTVFEVEVEVPVSQLRFLPDFNIINARTLDGYQLDLKFELFCLFKTIVQPPAS